MKKILLFSGGCGRKWIRSSLFLIIFSFALLISCQRETDVAPREDAALLPQIQAAKEWFEITTNISAADSLPIFSPPDAEGISRRDFNAKPDWKAAKIREGGVVEIPLLTKTRRIFPSVKHPAVIDQTAAVTRLLILQDENVGYYAIIMRITGDANYLPKVNYRLDDNAYMNMRDDFSGFVFFSYLDGRFCDGWRYEQGKLTGRASYSGVLSIPETADLAEAIPLATRGGIYCVIHLYYGWTICAGGEGFGSSSCSDVYFAHTVCETALNEFFVPPPDGGGGNYGDGGGGYVGGNYNNNYTPQQTPKANQIFKNLNMTLADWQNVENMLNKITNDCLGGELYNQFNSKLGSSTFSLNYDPFAPTATTNGNTSTITINSLTADDTFLHEIFHGYQLYGETASTWNASTANQEVEARLAKIKYYFNTYGDNTQTRAIIRSGYGEGFLLLYDMLDVKGVPNNTSAFNTAFYNLANTIVSIDPNRYNVDANRTPAQNLKNLQTLSKNCW